MFYYLEGTIAELLPYLAVVDCGGVGYACKTTSQTLSALKKGQRGKLYTHLQVGDGIFDLYGFASLRELDCFRLLLGVSGVGPRAALAILSTTTPEALATAIVTGDERSLMAAQGVGKKIAQRIILELKDKLAKDAAADLGRGPAARAFSSKAGEAAQALAVLGYSAQEAGAALKDIDMDALPLEEILRQALKRMVK